MSQNNSKSHYTYCTPAGKFTNLNMTAIANNISVNTLRARFKDKAPGFTIIDSRGVEFDLNKKSLRNRSITYEGVVYTSIKALANSTGIDPSNIYKNIIYKNGVRMLVLPSVSSGSDLDSLKINSSDKLEILFGGRVWKSIEDLKFAYRVPYRTLVSWIRNDLKHAPLPPDQLALDCRRKLAEKSDNSEDTYSQCYSAKQFGKYLSKAWW